MASTSKLGIVQAAFSVGQAVSCLQEAIREVPTEELPELIGRLESLKAVAWARLTVPATNAQEHDELIGVAEAASRLGVSEDYLHRHAQEYPFTRRQGRKVLFSALGINKYIREKKS